MHQEHLQEVLLQFFAGEVPAMDLQEAAQALLDSPQSAEFYQFRDMDSLQMVEHDHLLTICGAVLDGELAPECLQPISQVLSHSDKFEWEDEVITEVCYCWLVPEEMGVLTLDAVEQHRRWLVGEEPLP